MAFAAQFTIVQTLPLFLDECKTLVVCGMLYAWCGHYIETDAMLFDEGAVLLYKFRKLNLSEVKEV